ncbi:hypothetical protein Acr_24g0009040 [Actinidia rufa]|uniref:Uncharacterized protein n=1 Tax=Actinidia rufa TaxID=165716 RepID=A0A7J0GW24_9ERIC|nr:hypothetical protein Acr_24g0009040 [Actinidia rufa]
MVNASQASDLESIHHEMYGIAEQIKIMNEINALLVQHLATTIHLLPPHLSLKMLIDLVVLVTWAIRIRKIIIVLVRDIQQVTVSTSQQVYNIDEEGVLVYLNLDKSVIVKDRLAELKTRQVRKLGDGEDHLVGMTEYTNTMINPLPKNLKTLMLGLTP